MLAIIKTIDGVKKIVKVTADAGAGNPVGTIIPMYKKSSPSGYLYCDGSTFDETAYPLLYAYLGTNVLPDYREFALVGAEQNTTDVYNASTNPNGTIHDHDIYTEGQAKDDQLQNIVGEWYGERLLLIGSASGAVTQTDAQYYPVDQGTSGNHHTLYSFDASRVARAGTVTRGKRKAVYFYIKATSGLSENAQDNVINTLNEQRSYSTTEHLTGRKWIDGKPTYEVTVDCGALPNNTDKTIVNALSNVDTVIKLTGMASDGTAQITIPYSASANVTAYVYNNDLHLVTSDNLSAYSKSYVIIEYTKVD